MKFSRNWNRSLDLYSCFTYWTTVRFVTRTWICALTVIMWTLLMNTFNETKKKQKKNKQTKNKTTTTKNTFYGIIAVISTWWTQIWLTFIICTEYWLHIWTLLLTIKSSSTHWTKNTSVWNLIGIKLHQTWRMKDWDILQPFGRRYQQSCSSEKRQFRV